MMRPNLSKRLILEAPVRLSDGAGGYIETWVDVATVWGAVELRGSGRETDVASELALKITVRSAPIGAATRPTTEMRFRDETRLYSIVAVHEADPSNRYLTCFATEEVGI